MVHQPLVAAFDGRVGLFTLDDNRNATFRRTLCDRHDIDGAIGEGLQEASGDPDRWINAGACGRFHDRARLDFGSGRAGLSP